MLSEARFNMVLSVINIYLQLVLQKIIYSTKILSGNIYFKSPPPPPGNWKVTILIELTF